MPYFDDAYFDSAYFNTVDAPSFGPSTADQLISHDAALVFLTNQARDFVAGLTIQTGPPPAVVDSIAVTDAVTVQIGVTPSVQDSLSGTDAVTVRSGIPVFVFDSPAAVEFVALQFNLLLLSVSDAVSIAELAQASFGLEVRVVDTESPAEAVSLLNALVAVDSLTPDDAATVRVSPVANVEDTLVATESISVDLNVLVLSVMDSPAAVEAVSLLSPFVVQVFDTQDVDERRFAAFQKVKKVKVNPRVSTP